LKNLEKLVRYRYLIKRLHEAIEKNFDIQAIAYAYALIEDRFHSFLTYLRITPSSNHVKDKVKLVRQENSMNQSLSLLLTEALLGQIISWINERNKIMHGMAMMTMDEVYIKSVAIKGEKLVKQLNRLSPKVKLTIKQEGKSLIG
jgi:uncharacterized protein YfeS